MRQAVMTEPGMIKIQLVDDPNLADDEVLLRIKQIGICGSDVHVYHGKHPFTTYPVIQGHEFCGVVEKVGKKIQGIKSGMLATARPQLVCGRCGPCKRDQYNICEKLLVQGFQAGGCAQDLFAVSMDRLVLLPESLSYEQGALVEPTSVGCHSTKLVKNLYKKNVVVMGGGTIGNLIAQVAKDRGAAKVLLVDLSEFRLKAAHKSGINYISNANKEKFCDAITRVFGQEGFQVGFEAAGSQESLSNLIENIEKGGQIIIVGVFKERPQVDMSLVCEHEISLNGSMMYKHQDYLEAVQMIADGKINTEPLVTKHFPFKKYLEAYNFIDSRGDQSLKVMIDL